MTGGIPHFPARFFQWSRNVVTLITGGCTLFLLACPSRNNEIPVSEFQGEGFFQEVEHSTLSFYDSSGLKWKLNADYMRRPVGDTGNVLTVPVRLEFFDTAGAIEMRVDADSGTTDAQQEDLTVWGDVYVKTRDNVVVKAIRLNWNRMTRRVVSDTFVQIERPNGDILRGKGLKAAEDFSWWEMGAPSGVFPNFQQRMDNESE